MNDLILTTWTCAGLWLLAFFAAWISYGAYLVWRGWREQGERR